MTTTMLATTSGQPLPPQTAATVPTPGRRRRRPRRCRHTTGMGTQARTTVPVRHFRQPSRSMRRIGNRRCAPKPDLDLSLI